MVEQIRLPFPGKKLNEQEDDILLASLIFLKARNDIKQAKVGIGCVIRNRASNPRWWGRTYKQIITPLMDLFKISEEERDCVTCPIKNDLSEKWDECYLISKGIIENSIQDITFNSDFFFLTSEKLPSFLYKSHSSRMNSPLSPNFYVCTMGNVLFFRVELKWNNGNLSKT